MFYAVSIATWEAEHDVFWLFLHPILMNTMSHAGLEGNSPNVEKQLSRFLVVEGLHDLCFFCRSTQLPGANCIFLDILTVCFLPVDYQNKFRRKVLFVFFSSMCQLNC